MTAKDAYNNTLWNSLPGVVKKFIIDAIFNGKFQVNIEYRFYTTTNREANIRIIESLQELGYSVKCTEDRTLQISWD
jgi:hypothetical protein